MRGRSGCVLHRLEVGAAAAVAVALLCSCGVCLASLVMLKVVARVFLAADGPCGGQF